MKKKLSKKSKEGLVSCLVGLSLLPKKHFQGILKDLDTIASVNGENFSKLEKMESFIKSKSGGN